MSKRFGTFRAAGDRVPTSGTSRLVIDASAAYAVEGAARRQNNAMRKAFTTGDLDPFTVRLEVRRPCDGTVPVL
jgi:hypothetical protein